MLSAQTHSGLILENTTDPSLNTTSKNEEHRIQKHAVTEKK